MRPLALVLILLATEPAKPTQAALGGLCGQSALQEDRRVPELLARLDDDSIEVRAAAATALTAVPCPPSSLTPRLPATSPLAGSILPANSERVGLIPLSTIPILMPLPVAPAL